MLLRLSATNFSAPALLINCHFDRCRLHNDDHDVDEDEEAGGDLDEEDDDDSAVQDEEDGGDVDDEDVDDDGDDNPPQRCARARRGRLW